MNQQQTIAALIDIARAARTVVTESSAPMLDDHAMSNLARHLDTLDVVPPSEGDYISLAESRLSTYAPLSIREAVDIIANGCHTAAAVSGWWLDTETGEDVRTWPKKFLDLWISAKLMLIVTEVAESMEGHRKNLKDDKLPHLPMFMVELGDAFIRIGDLAGGLQNAAGVSLGQCVEEKIEYNASRADHKIENRLAAGGKSI